MQGPGGRDSFQSRASRPFQTPTRFRNSGLRNADNTIMLDLLHAGAIGFVRFSLASRNGGGARLSHSHEADSTIQTFAIDEQIASATGDMQFFTTEVFAVGEALLRAIPPGLAQRYTLATRQPYNWVPPQTVPSAALWPSLKNPPFCSVVQFDGHNLNDRILPRLDLMPYWYKQFSTAQGRGGHPQ